MSESNISRTKQPRFPIEPLLALLQQEGLNGSEGSAGTGDARINNSYLARRTGMNRATFSRYRKEGIPLYEADRVAISLSLHPCLVWPDFHDYHYDQEQSSWTCLSSSSSILQTT